MSPSSLPRPAAPERGTPRSRLRRIVDRFTLRQISTLMGLLGIALVLGAFALAAFHGRRVLMQEARDHAEQSAAYLADHALRLFEVTDFALHAANTATAGLDDTSVAASTDLRDTLHRLDEQLPYVDAMFVTDAAGNVIATTIENPPAHYSLADRSVFTEGRLAADDRLLISGAIRGRATNRPTFLVARRRGAPGAPFSGLVGMAMTLSYFTDYWATLDKRNDEEIALVRADTGSVLARYPPLPGDAQAGPGTLGSALVAAAQAGQAIGTFEDGAHSFGTFRRVGTLPVYLAVVFKDATVAAAWRRDVGQLLLPAGATIVLLLGMMALARRLARREAVARRQIETARAVLSAANTRLERRVGERTADLLESNREIQRFAYIVSHDLRAPLVNIIGFTSELQVLRDEVLDADRPPTAAERARMRADFDEAFGFIESSIDKMDRLIKAILAISRQGQRTFRPERLDMEALVRSIADALAHQAQQSGVTIAIDPLPAVMADRIAVEQVFSNLVDNAIKYRRDGVPGLVEIGGTASSTTATFTVKDNGRGIAEADRERVFELFRRAGRQDRPGEGIGLANVRSLIRRLQGTITLDSQLGFGCVFTITLPLVGTAGPEPD